MNKPATYNLPTNVFGDYQRIHGYSEVTASRIGVDFIDRDYNTAQYMKKDEAIQLAKDLLVFYKVPFCNKVSDGQ